MFRSTASGLILALALVGCGKSDAGSPTPTPAPVEKSDQADKPADNAAPSASTGATAGAEAPDFTLKDLDGKAFTLSSFRGKTVVLEWFNPDCPFVVKQHNEGPLKAMAKELSTKGVVWLSINSGAPGKQGTGVERNKKALGEYGMENPVLLDEDGKVGKLYQAKTTPHMVVITPEGTLAYLGAIDNAPMGKAPESGFVNHVTEALADVEAKRAVRVPQTKGYGCSVKYLN